MECSNLIRTHGVCAGLDRGDVEDEAAKKAFCPLTVDIDLVDVAMDSQPMLPGSCRLGSGR